MKALVFGSCNLDYVYKVSRIVSPGETLGVKSVTFNPGGKGLNQSVALKKAGMDVFFSGCRGEDGAVLEEILNKNGVDTRFMNTVPCPTGAAYIQVTDEGENAILLYHGANYAVTGEMIDKTLSYFSEGDLLVAQNEISELKYLLDEGYKRGMKLILNPSPFDESMKDIDYSKIWLVFVNETELKGLSDGKRTEAFIDETRVKYPETRWVITLGEKGSVYFDRSALVKQEAIHANAVDTTCAGDTFTGFFTAAVSGGKPVDEALLLASAASSITVSRVGAAGMIPSLEETEKLLGDIGYLSFL